MEFTTLGRTGLKVSVAGLGCGGPSRLGLRNNRTEKESVSLVRQALDMGVNLIDTAGAYGTEHIVGQAVNEFSREQVVISTKIPLPPRDTENPSVNMKKNLEESLLRLKTDYIDILLLHGVEPKDYIYALDKLAPVLMRMKEVGKIRFFGVTEAFSADLEHQMLQRALEDDCWDVVMVGFNMLNQSARAKVLRRTQEKDIGVLLMFAVRKALSRPARLMEVWAELSQRGLVNSGRYGSEAPLDFLISEGGATTITDAAYRYCRHEPGVHVVLTGTGNPNHLKDNVDSLLKPPLHEPVLCRIREIFEKVNFLNGN